MSMRLSSYLAESTSLPGKIFEISFLNSYTYYWLHPSEIMKGLLYGIIPPYLFTVFMDSRPLFEKLDVIIYGLLAIIIFYHGILFILVYRDTKQGTKKNQ